ncbi:family 1 glycosylhydrolase, partial [Nocardia abscessus]|uniref:family 1 glycosylhydrolase n=1 Tax=Nocardia abscessus TaxID=120957 RepID=UPI00278BF3E8
MPQSPESMYYVLRYFATKYPNKPLRVIENGLATDADQNRADGYRRDDHLRDTVYWIQRARQDGINIVSYNYWSLTDNYEWGEYGPVVVTDLKLAGSCVSTGRGGFCLDMVWLVRWLMCWMVGLVMVMVKWAW